MLPDIQVVLFYDVSSMSISKPPFAHESLPVAS